MITLACLGAILAACAAARTLELVLRALRLDPWDVLLYLGLAEYELPRHRRRLGARA